MGSTLDRSWSSLVDAAVGHDPARVERSLRMGVVGLTGIGVLHFVAPKFFDAIIPRWVPGRPRTWTHLSGVAELASAALLANPSTRRVGGYLAAGTFVAVFPANLQMSIDRPPTTPYGLALAARIPLQVPMVAWALGHAARAGNPQPTRG